MIKNQLPFNNQVQGAPREHKVKITPNCGCKIIIYLLSSNLFSSVSSVAQSCMTLWPHGLQHARPPSPSPTPGVYSNSCPLSWWCHQTISSVIPFSSCLQSFPASGSFQMSHFCASDGQSKSFSFRISPSNEYSGMISFRKSNLLLNTY